MQYIWILYLDEERTSKNSLGIKTLNIRTFYLNLTDHFASKEPLLYPERKDSKETGAYQGLALRRLPGLIYAFFLR